MTCNKKLPPTIQFRSLWETFLFCSVINHVSWKIIFKYFLRLTFNSKTTKITYFHPPEAFSITVHSLPSLLYILPNSQRKKDLILSSKLYNDLLSIYEAMSSQLAQKHKSLLKETGWRKVYWELLLKLNPWYDNWN